MKNELKYYFWFALLVFILLGFFWGYISRGGKKVAKEAEAEGVIIFYDATSDNLRMVAMNPTSTKVFKNSNGAEYLLQSECTGQSTSICDVNGAKLKEVLLTGKQIATSDLDYVLIQKTFEKNKKPWEMTYDYGLVLLKTEDEVQENSTEHTPTAKMIMWDKSILAVYDKDENKFYEKLFFGRNLNIEKVLPCTSSKVVVFSSEDEYPEKFGPDWEYYDTNQRISFSVIDYHQNSNAFQLDIENINLQKIDDFEFSFEDIQWPIYCGTKLVSVEEFSNMDVTSSQDGIHVAGIINDSDVFLINVVTEQTKFIKPLTRYINGNANSKVLQIEVSNSGAVHVIRHYTGNKDLVVYENYDKTDNITQMHIIKDMGDTATMHIDKTKVIIVDGTKKNTIKLM